MGKVSSTDKKTPQRGKIGGSRNTQMGRKPDNRVKAGDMNQSGLTFGQKLSRQVTGKITEDRKNFKDRIKEYSKSTDHEKQLGFKIYKHADKLGIHPAAVRDVKVIRAQLGLKKSQITENVMRYAIHLDHYHNNSIQTRLGFINTGYAALALTKQGIKFQLTEDCEILTEKERLEKKRVEAEKALAEKKRRESLTPVSVSDKQVLLFDIPVKKIIRWMGSDGWNFKQCNRVLHELFSGMEEHIPDKKTIKNKLQSGINSEVDIPEKIIEKLYNLI